MVLDISVYYCETYYNKLWTRQYIMAGRMAKDKASYPYMASYSYMASGKQRDEEEDLQS
jgi:hypothetical protein